MASTSRWSSRTGRPFTRGRTRVTYTNPSPGEARLTFGKHKGMTLAEIVEAGECSYVQWLARTARTSPAPELRTFGRIAARYLKTLRKGGAVNGNQEER